MYHLKFLVVWVLLDVGEVLDWLPQIAVKSNGRVGLVRSGYGCMTGLCTWTMRLDEKWDTGHYRPL